MSETTSEAPAKQKAQFDAPADVPEDEATGHAVYNTTLGQFVGPVHRDGRPSATQVKELVPEGHSHKVVRV